MNNVVETRVCSFGGVGSSNILMHIESGNRRRITLHQRRKHTIHPKYLVDKGTKKVLFMVGNPYNALLSVFRRNYQRQHEISMGYGKYWFNRESEMKVHINNDTTIDNYLKSGADRFNMYEHFYNWYNYEKNDIQILIIKYEYLYLHINYIMKFLDCNKPFTVKKRLSDWRKESDDVKNGFENMYGDLKSKIDSIPSIIKKNVR